MSEQIKTGVGILVVNYDYIFGVTVMIKDAPFTILKDNNISTKVLGKKK